MSLDDLIFYKNGAMSFLDKTIPDGILTQILTAATSCAWLGRWRLLSVTDKDRRNRVVTVWQEALRKIGRAKDSEIIEKWRLAPLFISFCQPRKFDSIGWVRGDYARIYSIQEVGTAVRSLELKALELGIGLHGIMGVLMPEIGDRVKAELGIPKDQELAYFGIMGYPDKTAEQNFPKLNEVCYTDTWGRTPGSEGV